MLKVFLVEDEFIVREGIKNIDWKQYGYHFCGEASDGELAYPLILKEKPDIVITDIKMPFMDGLSLSRMVKEALPDTQIIILTGHEEFEYAKEGISIGVAEYLLKPISCEKLLEVIHHVGESILERRKEQALISKFQQEMEEDYDEQKRQLFYHLMNGSKSLQEIMELSKKLDLNLSAICYNVALVKMKSLKHEDQEYSKRIIKVRNQLKETGLNKRILLFDRDLEGTAILFMGDNLQELEEKQEEFLKLSKEILSSYDDVKYFIGVGNPVHRLSELPISFEQASHAFANRFLMESNQILHFREMEMESKEEKLSLDQLDTKQFDRGRILEFLRTGNEMETGYFVDEFLKNIGASIIESKMFRQYIAMDIYFCVTEFVSSIKGEKAEIKMLDMTSGVTKDVESTKDYLICIIRQAVLFREQVASNRYGDVVDAVVRYIELHYQEEELSLNMVASHVNFSPNHLSSVFSQQTGQTFIKYLTDYRMGKARELLKCSNRRTHQIAQEVGYKDAHYFSYLFKKTQGMTPTQYRS